MFTRELQATLSLAVNEAVRRRHEYLTLEHVLFALLHDPTAIKVIRNCGGDVEALKQDIDEFLATQLEQLAVESDHMPEQTAAFQRVLEYALRQAQGSGQNKVDGGNILAALFQERHSHAVYLLKKQGIARLDVLNYISHGISKVKESGEAFSGKTPEPIGDADDEDRPITDPLEAFTTNLIDRAAQGKIDPLIGRKTEVDRTIQVLCRRRKNNPVYVGDPGVGKTAIAEGLALKIYRGEVPETLRSAEMYMLDLGSMLAGTKYRGEFEQRFKAVINALKKKPGAIMVIDEIHTIVGAGAVSGGTMDASNMLKPVLASGELRCIGSTTYPEYKASFERDRALGRRFQKIDVVEPTIDETIQILNGLKSYYEAHHGVTYTDGAIEAAARLAAKYINDRCLPDKAIDVIDESGASLRLLDEADRPSQIDIFEIEQVIARMARIPPKTVSVSDKDRLKQLEKELKSVIYGQDAAISRLVKTIMLSRAGLGHPDKPIGSFLFSGPTGVGKTELAKQLAQALGVAFLRFDMSEYSEKHTVSRLIGAPPGYVGFDQGGLLTDQVNKHPYSVIVLDEIEKAHPDLFNILLQVMDHATLTDNNGKKADFRNVILIMTTNAGARDMTAESIGFRESATIRDKSKDAIEKTFSPEFRNRLDAWVVFGQLSLDVIEQVVDKFVRELGTQLKEKNVTIELTEPARLWLATKGYDKLFGARPMGRVIQSKLKEPLAEKILFGELEQGGRAVVTVVDDEIVIEGHPLEPASTVSVEKEPVTT
ncbi:MAG TPA: ATP-dependent Clp protease ATP-binding subunit ClpA [Acidobacteriota bacterium]|nr:ATP-dependent Clp protease ATP-binding subunit ClpA [Acidobacteriota bacterium]